MTAAVSIAILRCLDGDLAAVPALDITPDYRNREMGRPSSLAALQRTASRRMFHLLISKVAVPLTLRGCLTVRGQTLCPVLSLPPSHPF